MPKDSFQDDDPKPWTVIKSEYLYQSKWLTARKEHVRLANGAEMADYYVLEYSDWVNAVLLTEDEKVVLVRIYRHGLGETHYELPGGCVDPGETPLDAAKRESLEETGYQADSWESIGECSANPATHTNKTFLFIGHGARRVQAPEQEDTEEILTVPVHLKEIPGILERGEVISASHALGLSKLCRRFGL